MVDELLGLFLSEAAIFQISLNIDVKEGRHTANTHGCTVLGFHSCQISKVQPLYCFFCILGRLGNIKAVDLSHLLHLTKCLILSADLFSLTDHIIRHSSISAVREIFCLLLHQKINSVQSHTTVVTDDTSSSVGVRKSGNDLVVTCFLHLRSISIEDALIMSSAVLGKDFV